MPEPQGVQQVDTAAQQNENQPAGGSRTYTQDELDAAIDKAVKARIDKQNTKHSREMSAKDDELASVSKQVSDLQGRIDAYEAAEARTKIIQAVAKETGVDAELLERMAGDDEDAIRTNAGILKAKMDKIPKNPAVVDNGSNPKPKLSKEQILEMKNPSDRVRAIAENRGVFD